MGLEGCHRKKLARLTQIGVFVWAAMGLGIAQGAPLARATDLVALRALAHARHEPIVLLFWSPTCRYCAVVERDFLGPAASEPRFRRIVFRRVDIDSQKPLIDFAGHKTTEARFAKRFHVALVPDIKFFDAQGRKVGADMRGLSTPDFYAAYLDSALDDAQNVCQRSLRAKPS